MSDVEEGASEEQIELNISSPEVVTKYRLASDIAAQALKIVVDTLKPRARVVELCDAGDSYILQESSKYFNKGKSKFGHFSPLAEDETQIQDGDVVKIDLGVHIDGFIATCAHTVVVGTSRPVTGRKADVLLAAHNASEAALRLLKPGRKSSEVTEVIQRVAEQYNCQACEGVLSHNMKQFVIDGDKVIPQRTTPEQKFEEFEFEDNDVFHVDIVISTGEGKTRVEEARTTVYKRAVDVNYQLKMQASRYVFSEINRRFPALPFTIRALEDKRGRLGIVEVAKHDLVIPYPVLYEKEGEYVAQVKFTALLLPTGTLRITNFPLQEAKSDFEIKDPELVSLLSTSTKKKNKKKKNKKKSGGDGESMEVEQ